MNVYIRNIKFKIEKNHNHCIYLSLELRFLRNKVGTYSSSINGTTFLANWALAQANRDLCGVYYYTYKLNQHLQD